MRKITMGHEKWKEGNGPDFYKLNIYKFYHHIHKAKYSSEGNKP